MEHENQIEAAPLLCTMECGFFGTETTDNMCSKCFNDQIKKKNTPTSRISKPEVSSVEGKISSATAVDLIEAQLSQVSIEGGVGSPEKTVAKKKKNKCHICKKKIGLTGFTCRCGGLYCSLHRYSNEHQCTFDYRELGAKEIRQNNPVIKAEKIQKI